MNDNKLVSANNAHTTIEEVLLKFAEQYESPYSYMRRADEPLSYQLSEARQDLTEDCLAAIEQLVLDEVIGRSEVIGKTGIRPAQVYNIRDDLRVEQRQALTKLLRGCKENHGC